MRSWEVISVINENEEAPTQLTVEKVRERAKQRIKQEQRSREDPILVVQPQANIVHNPHSLSLEDFA